jgi:hypothetical protein
MAVQVFWFIAPLAAVGYSIKYAGGPKTLWVAFSVSFLLCLWIVPLTILRGFHRYHNFLTLRALLVPAFFAVQATIYGVACWAVWKRKPSARPWCNCCEPYIYSDSLLHSLVKSSFFTTAPRLFSCHAGCRRYWSNCFLQARDQLQHPKRRPNQFAVDEKLIVTIY